MHLLQVVLQFVITIELHGAQKLHTSEVPISIVFARVAVTITPAAKSRPAARIVAYESWSSARSTRGAR